MKQEDFDEYIRQVEPSARQSAANWQTAIGNELKNRSMLINAPEGWNATDDKPTTNDALPTITDDKPTIILAYLKEICHISNQSIILTH